MPESHTDPIRRYLQDAIAAENSFESQLRAFAEHGDDDEVRAFFAVHADQTKFQHDRLAARLEELGESPSAAKALLAHAFVLAPKAGQVTYSQEERTAQNLILAFSIEQAECATYEALASVARATNDPATESLARQIQAEEKEAATRIWRFLPSRCKIAFNMLTAGEVDPAVETRASENRVVS